MKRRPVIEHRRPDEAEQKRRDADRRRLRAYVQGCIARAIRECDFAKPAQLGREFIVGGARIVQAAQDGPGAASALGAASHRIAPALPSSPARRPAEAHLTGGRG
jgi:hypothetical protein